MQASGIRLNNSNFPSDLGQEIMMRNRSVGIGIGVIVAVLIALALTLFGIVSPVNGIATMFLLVGLWIVVFGAAFSKARDRLFFVGWGLVVAVLSTFAFLPLQYALGLEVVVILIVVLLSVFMRPAQRTPQPAGAGPAPP